MKYLTQDVLSARTLLCLSVFFTLIVKSSQLTISDCGVNYRRPDYNDISVFCGTNYVRLSIFICPVMYAGLNESMLFLNNMNDPNCKGTLDTSVTPPVVRFTFPLNSSSACGSVFTTITSLGSGIYSDFSKVQTVNISGIVRSVDPSTSIVTYNTDLTYYYSCSYPLQYLLNNTDVSVSASSIAVRDNNGSFISTLKIGLFRDANYTNPLAMPSQGIELKTNIYVQVQATNLTSQYFVLLDRCYASTSPLPSNSSFFNLFVSCSIDKMTTVVENGQSQSAKFYFPAFRFREQQNMTLSTYYLHCITRLCEPASCSQFWSCSSNNGRRKRDLSSSTPVLDGVTSFITLTSPAITTKAESSKSLLCQQKKVINILKMTTGDSGLIL
ncbi:zona pellucida-like domain-containing protein 1 isoform X2 [Denticeps clupeoides]|uniref:zona pellucida-like domain-containing protein 1 isoform X2 n=1 Tax=Denticeps clupeoides TaxID=299321 RepID=UPI0010A40DA7|nr:zona pellucida-like domain-containing protein 1 isoform X2 [Denticeps clupeoides]